MASLAQRPSTLKRNTARFAALLRWFPDCSVALLCRSTSRFPRFPLIAGGQGRAGQ